jgi:hypothetical protein
MSGFGSASPWRKGKAALVGSLEPPGALHHDLEGWLAGGLRLRERGESRKGDDAVEEGSAHKRASDLGVGAHRLFRSVVLV